ncbi:germ cell-less protein-like 1 [Ditylenchus destructor]|uniref:Germ cell-less protein-like 1 n=1 Tax=Ditylenchus destructor TaxID=166010 RepID=A0AAD4N573_9BILA|nr:germ cell-less protein-like 1 [Ditylenchus destructor]
MGSVLGREDDEASTSSFPSTVIDPIGSGPLTSGFCNRKCSNNSGNRKRTHSNTSDDIDAKCFKLDTPKYVHQKLFVEGCDSDVVIHAMGHSWKLHRVYLEQCDYFRALFQGNWSDSKKMEYTLDFDDPNICFVGLDNVFASLYNNEIEIDREHIAGVVASAALLNLTSVLNRCSDLLSSYLSAENILLCLHLAETYGFVEKLNDALKFLKTSFWRYCLSNNFLKELTPYWFAKILSFASDVLCVKENEMDLYIAIRNWIYFQNYAEDDVDEKKMRDFFASEDYDWRIYIDIFRHIRVSNLVLMVSTNKLLKKDRMIPPLLLDWVIRDSWNTMLLNEESIAP